jgi:hypothetical protein
VLKVAEDALVQVGLDLLHRRDELSDLGHSAVLLEERKQLRGSEQQLASVSVHA